jgi:uncharacterized protein (DUF433 family)
VPIVALEYIAVDDRGVAKLIGSRAKVMSIVMDQMNGYSPTEIHAHYPQLSMAQIHAALAYYYDHKSEVDIQIEESIRFVTEMRAAHPNRHTRDEMEAMLKARQTPPA